MVDEDKLPWDPLPISSVAALFAHADFLWWIAGGYAIELTVDRALRDHSDPAVGVPRRHQVAIRRLLAGWDCWAADPPGVLRPWPVDEILPDNVHDIWCREHAAGPWRLQLMLDNSDDELWQSRRDPRLTRPIAEVRYRTPDGIPYIAPEIQLHYKAKAARPKDELDLAAVLPAMQPNQREWLVKAIALTYGSDHPWLRRIVQIDGGLAPRGSLVGGAETSSGNSDLEDQSMTDDRGQCHCRR
jgi:hypothetical protein